jgi:hypothetical protein
VVGSTLGEELGEEGLGAEMATHVFFSLTNAKDGRDDEYESWYRDVHMPEVMEIRGFVSAQRFKVSESQLSGMTSPWKYLAIYQIEGESPGDALAELSRRISSGAMSMSDALSPDVAAWTYSPVEFEPR